MELGKKVALITGGTGELGTALTSAFINEGASVAATYYSEPEAEKFRSRFPDALTFKADLSKEADVVRIFGELLEQKKRIDVLCNLVGGYMPKKEIADLTEKEWDFMFSLNLKTCFLCSRSALRIMRKQKYGRIINVSAMAGLTPEAGRGSYGLSKNAVAAFTAIAGEEVKLISDADITVNAIAPSVLLTSGNVQSASKEDLRRWVTLEQASAAITFLASDKASAINGQTIKVYGDV
ncbi:MAG TPA: SDR family NAD(P)-dependent oxidoreductase [Bacteroidota bacterium]|nr:SDR family NAD(P)-dependent oxidoreductase [Bacteroidota bacterium]